MQVPSNKKSQKVAILATGGTIAGVATADAGASGDTQYTAAQIGIGELLAGFVAAVPQLANLPLVAEQVAQIDSKDMTWQVWRDLLARCMHHLADPNVAGVVITHGTDTVEETAFFLHCCLPSELQAAKPVVLTCAMRPASSPDADGPANLADAVAVARDAQASGVLVVCAGDVHAAVQVQKVHSHRLNAFASGDSPSGSPVARVSASKVVWQGDLPAKLALCPTSTVLFATKIIANALPLKVDIVFNHTDADGRMVDALVASGTRGIVVAATGNGTVSAPLQAALLRAQSAGVRVLRSSRCVWGEVSDRSDDVLPSTPLPPVKARIWLVLQLLGQLKQLG